MLIPLSPSEGGGPLSSYNSILVRGRPNIHMLLSPSEGGGTLFTSYSVLVREEAHYIHAIQS